MRRLVESPAPKAANLGFEKGNSIIYLCVENDILLADQNEKHRLLSPVLLTAGLMSLTRLVLKNDKISNPLVNSTPVAFQ